MVNWKDQHSHWVGGYLQNKHFTALDALWKHVTLWKYLFSACSGRFDRERDMMYDGSFPRFALRLETEVGRK